MASNQDRISPDNPDTMMLYDAYEMGIQAGTYRLILQQTVELTGQAGTEAHHYYRDQRFAVQGPRFLLEQREVHACFPPVGAVGDFRQYLPHVVLRKRALPWERPICGNMEELLADEEARKRAPWLALLVLNENDFPPATTQQQGATSAAMPALTTLSTDAFWGIAKRETSWCVVEDGQRVLLPAIECENPDEKQPPERPQDNPTGRLQLLDLPLDLFLALRPRVTDLKYLAHLRCVDTRDKAPLDMHADGEFSVLVANRLPPPGTNTVYLVSLEGWDSLIAGKQHPGQEQAPGSQPCKVRLVTLGSWRFVNDVGSSYTFGGLVRGLDLASFGIGLTKEQGIGNRDVCRLLGQGYVPVEHRKRNSAQGELVFYHGPCSATRVDGIAEPAVVSPQRRPAPHSEAVTGIRDISAASAWQLGRLLALAAPGFAAGLRAFEAPHKPYESVADIADRLVFYMEMHRSSVRPLAPRDEADRDRQAKREAKKKTELKTRGARNRVEMVADLIDWLARLVLLYPVPFDYLVPDPRLLPRESLRFFYLDDNWLESLAAGALSIAIRRPPVPAGETAPVAPFATSLSMLIYQNYLRTRGRVLVENPECDFLREPKSGFLVRSALISGWPGVEVKVKSSAMPVQVVISAGANEYHGEEPLPAVLRVDRLAEDLLLCIVRGTFEDVTLKEPPEGLKFGVSQNDGASVSVAKDNGCSDSTESIRVPAVFHQDPKYQGKPPGAVDLDVLAKALDCKGSAALAKRMIRAPEMLTIAWKPGEVRGEGMGRG